MTTDLRLSDGSRIGVVGAGPAGSFFSYFVLQMAQRVSLDIKVDIYEPRDFSRPAPHGCNMCGGIVSESLVQNLAAEGINLPPGVVQRSIDSYFLHMEEGSVRIETPLQEKRIAAVHRGAGPRDGKGGTMSSFDGFLLELAKGKGASHIQDRVTGIAFEKGRPRITAHGGSQNEYDLLAVAVGLNTSTLKLFQDIKIPYKPPGSTKAYICEFFLGHETIQRYLGSSMHIFLLDIPGLQFAAIIPKGTYATLCLLGDDISKQLISTFLNDPKVKQCMPPHWQPLDDFCRCSPKINIKSAVEPFADRMIFIGDCGTSRLYKDGIGAAYRTAKAAAITAIFKGISTNDFRESYWRSCRSINNDNRLGKFIFGVTSQIKKRRFARKGVWRMVSREQQKEGTNRRMSAVLWDTFTGSAPYKNVLMRTFHPSFQSRFAWDIVAGSIPFKRKKGKKGKLMYTKTLGKLYRDGEAIVRQGEMGESIYVIQSGEVEVIQRKGDKEFCLAVLGEGDFFGEIALLDQEAHSASVHALGEVRVLTLEKRGFLRRIHEDPSLAFKIMQKMSRRVRELETALIRKGSADY